MRIEGPERYQLTFTSKTFTVLCAKGTNRFSGLATSDLPKLYIASIENTPVYRHHKTTRPKSLAVRVECER
jgi:hypothetical protein